MSRPATEVDAVIEAAKVWVREADEFFDQNHHQRPTPALYNLMHAVHQLEPESTGTPKGKRRRPRTIRTDLKAIQPCQVVK